MHSDEVDPGRTIWELFNVHILLFLRAVMLSADPGLILFPAIDGLTVCTSMSTCRFLYSGLMV